MPELLNLGYWRCFLINDKLMDAKRIWACENIVITTYELNGYQIVFSMFFLRACVLSCKFRLLIPKRDQDYAFTVQSNQGKTLKWNNVKKKNTKYLPDPIKNWLRVPFLRAHNTIIVLLACTYKNSPWTEKAWFFFINHLLEISYYRGGMKGQVLAEELYDIH